MKVSVEAKERVLAVHRHAFITCGDSAKFAVYSQEGEFAETLGEGDTEDEAWISASSHSSIASPKPPEYTCSHCSGDMRVNRRCSNDGFCRSIADVESSPAPVEGEAKKYLSEKTDVPMNAECFECGHERGEHWHRAQGVMECGESECTCRAFRLPPAPQPAADAPEEHIQRLWLASKWSCAECREGKCSWRMHHGDWSAALLVHFAEQLLGNGHGLTQPEIHAPVASTPAPEQEEKAILPCPFCGGSDVKTAYVRDGRAVRCGDIRCLAEGGTAYHGPNGDTDERAIALWNRRASPTLPKEEADVQAGKDADWAKNIRGLLFTLGMKEEMSNWGGDIEGWGAAFEWVKYHVKQSQDVQKLVDALRAIQTHQRTLAGKVITTPERIATDALNTWKERANGN